MVFATSPLGVLKGPKNKANYPQHHPKDDADHPHHVECGVHFRISFFILKDVFVHHTSHPSDGCSDNHNSEQTHQPLVGHHSKSHDHDKDDDNILHKSISFQTFYLQFSKFLSFIIPYFSHFRKLIS